MEFAPDNIDDFQASVQSLCHRIAGMLQQLNARVVFAESCTSGLAAALLGGTPGISDYLCGSAVTYRNRTKQAWLGVPGAILENPGPVSEEVAVAMARGVLDSTVEAQLAISITGHLGPGAPPELDGVVHLGIAWSDLVGQVEQDGGSVTRCCRLTGATREVRQRQAAWEVLVTLHDVLQIARGWNDLRKGTVDRWAITWSLDEAPGSSRGTTVNSMAPRYLFPGSFNPRHAGHRDIACYVRDQLQEAVAYELSIENVDKPDLDFGEVMSRLFQFARTDPVWLTRQPTFAGKAALFPGATFVVGVDTVVRIAERRYYQDDSGRCEAMAEIHDRGCRFLVFGRVLDRAIPEVGVVDPGFYLLDDLDLAEDLAHICTAVPESAFRRDISSTALRAESERG